MNKFLDITESKLILEASKREGVIGGLLFTFGKAEEVNKNGRLYPDDVWNSAVSELNMRIAGNRVPGSLDHPLTPNTRLGDVSHVLTKVWVDKDKVGWANAEILDTSRGRDVMKLIKSKVKFGASLRGFGEVDKNGKVKSGLQIKSVDLVADPSFGDQARIHNTQVFESTTAETRGEKSLRLHEERFAGMGREAVHGMPEKKEMKKPKRDKRYVEENAQAGYIPPEDEEEKEEE